MGIQDKENSLQRLVKAFQHAIDGIVACYASERNIKIQTAIGLLVVIVAVFFQIERLEWAVLILCIGFVLSLELINSAIEKTIDLYCQDEYHPLAKFAKDVAAGAVLFASVVAVVVGLLVFLPYIIVLFKSLLE